MTALTLPIATDCSTSHRSAAALLATCEYTRFCLQDDSADPRTSSDDYETALELAHHNSSYAAIDSDALQYFAARESRPPW